MLTPLKNLSFRLVMRMLRFFIIFSFMLALAFSAGCQVKTSGRIDAGVGVHS